MRPRAIAVAVLASAAGTVLVPAAAHAAAYPPSQPPSGSAVSPGVQPAPVAVEPSDVTRPAPTTASTQSAQVSGAPTTQVSGAQGTQVSGVTSADVSGANSSSLPFTGSDLVLGGTAVGLALVAAGSGVLVAGRRRSHTAR